MRFLSIPVIAFSLLLSALAVFGIVNSPKATPLPHPSGIPSPFASQAVQVLTPTKTSVPTTIPSVTKSTEMISAAWTACQVDSDCIYARNDSEPCPIGVNKAYAKNFQYTCAAHNLNNCPSVIAPECNWHQLGCAGAPNVHCLSNQCIARPCGFQ